MPTNKSFFKQILIWRYKYISERQFVYALSVLVGLLAGLGTAVLKNLTFFFESVLEGKFIKDFHYSLYFIFPIIGLDDILCQHQLELLKMYAKELLNVPKTHCLI